MPKKLTYSFIKEQFKIENYILISKDYINCSEKLECLCPKGHTCFISWDHFKRGIKCPICTKENKKIKLFDYIKIFFKKEGYTLLSTDYIDNTTKLECICPNGHKTSIRWNTFQQGHGCYYCGRNSISGEKHPHWKGGIKHSSFPLYETYAPQLEKYYKIYKIVQDNLELLGVECMYCNQVFVPTVQQIMHRLSAIRGKTAGEKHLYCSENCKKACPTYGQIKYPKGFKPATSREVQPELRKLVLARDGYRCIKCGKGLEESELHCHHIDPVINNPIESADIDNCITLCYTCHKEAHNITGCGYNDLKCN